jgi:glycerol-3-phosphate acyltransferase PlsY
MAPAPIWQIVLRLVGTAVVAYLVGSTPSGVLVGRVFGNVDPREHGSGKTGATNILRTLGPGAAVAVGITDLLKGVVPVLLARYLLVPPGAAWDNLRLWGEVIAGFGALFGHNYSVFIHFRGGRGVATGGGSMFAMNPFAGIFGVLGFIIPIATTRYVSLGSIVASASAAVGEAVLVATGHDRYQHLIFIAGGAAFIIYAHKDNIDRLLKGTERKLGDKSQ